MVAQKKRSKATPVPALTWSKRQVASACGVGEGTIDLWVRSPDIDFPKSRKMPGIARARWIAAEVTQWLAALPAKSGPCRPTPTCFMREVAPPTPDSVVS